METNVSVLLKIKLTWHWNYRDVFLGQQIALQNLVHGHIFLLIGFASSMILQLDQLRRELIGFMSRLILFLQTNTYIAVSNAVVSDLWSPELADITAMLMKDELT